MRVTTAAAAAHSIDVGHWMRNGSDGTMVCEVGDEGGSLVLIGIAIGLLSSCAINLGQNLQAMGAKEAGDSHPCSSTQWVVGLSTFIAGSIGNMIAMAFASATILVPLESTQFVTNIIFSKVVHKADTTWRQWMGTWIAVAGTVLTCVFGPNDARCFTLGTLEGFWTSPVWIAYVIGTVSASALSWVAYFRLRASDLASSDTAVAHVGLPALFAVASALIGGAQMIVHSKALAELIDMLMGGELTLRELLGAWFFWVELAITAGCGTFWAIQMNAAITLYDPMFIIPLLQASYIVFGSAASGLFYQEFDMMSASEWGVWAWPLYAGGVLLVVLGIMMLAPARACYCGFAADEVDRSSSSIYSRRPYDSIGLPYDEGGSSGTPPRAPWALPSTLGPVDGTPAQPTGEVDAKQRPLLDADDVQTIQP